MIPCQDLGHAELSVREGRVFCNVCGQMMECSHWNCTVPAVLYKQSEHWADIRFVLCAEHARSIGLCPACAGELGSSQSTECKHCGWRVDAPLV